MLGAEVSGALHAHQEDHPMAEARLFSDVLGEANLTLTLQRDG